MVGLTGFASTQRHSQALTRLLLAIGVLGVVAAFVFVVVHRTQSQNDTAVRQDAAAKVPSAAGLTAAAAADAQTAGWVVANLPRTSRLLADVSLRDALVKKGFASDRVIDYDAGPARDHYDYVLAGPAARTGAAAAVPGSVLAEAMSRSRAVAVFGTSADRVEVRQILSASDADNPVDVSARAAAGRQLLLNPNVQASPEVRTVLDAGDLDLRAATLVAAVASSTTVRLLDVPQNAAEERAKAPVRTVRLAVDDQAALTSTLASLPTQFRPLTPHLAADGSELITWVPDAVPEPPVG